MRNVGEARFNEIGGDEMDMEKAIKGLEICINRIPGKYTCNECPYEIDGNYCEINLSKDALALLKGFQSTLGIVQTAESITFVSTGDAKQGEDRGIMLGKSFMHEYLKKELLHRGLLTDEIRSVFNNASTNLTKERR